MHKSKIVIIGSGPAGLGAAYRLKDLGIEDFVLLEQLDYPGGLAASFVDDNGFTWDIGGHVQFSHYAYFDEMMIHALGEQGWLHHQRESWVWIEDRFVPYPFQNNIRHLSRESLWKCLQGVIDIYKNPSTKKPANFAEWIHATFGEGLAEVFMMPYNFKVWAYPPETMSYQWIGERVAITDLEKVTENIILEKDNVSWGPNSTFQFPKHGGTGSIWKAIAHQIGLEKIRLEQPVVQIDPSTRQIKTATGEVYEYDHLLSTMPLDQLTKLIVDCPSHIVERSQELVHSTSHIVGVGLNGKPKDELATKCWMYFPESNCPFYRVTVFSNYSPFNVPDINNNWSLMTETSESSAKPVDRDNLIEETIQGLLNTRLIADRNDIVSTWHYTAEYGYPTPSVERDQILSEVLPYLDGIGVYSRGRFGAWKYEVSNQDHTCMQGVEWVNRVILQIPEVTVQFPGFANQNWGRRI